MKSISLGPFLLTSRLGGGAQGEVYKSLYRPDQPGGGTPVALKFLTGIQSPTHRLRFRREVQTISGLAHSRIVAVLDYREVTADEAHRIDARLPAGCPYLAMEYVDGRTLLEHCGLLAWPRMRTVLEDILAGLAHAHARGVVHCDIKPGNVMVDDQSGVAKLVDFGISTVIDPIQVDSRSNRYAMGTPRYMAPEQIDGRRRDLGPWTDLYALGALVYPLVTGRHFFPDISDVDELFAAQRSLPPPPLPADSDVPSGFQDWVFRLLAKNPADRFPQAADARRALNALSGTHPDPERPFGAWSASAVGTDLPPAGRGLYALRSPPMVGRTEERRQLWTHLNETAARASWPTGGPGARPAGQSTTPSRGAATTQT